MGHNRGRAPRLLKSANPPGKVGLFATRDLQRFIGYVEGEDLFLFSFQGGHSINPFSVRLTPVAANIGIQKRTLANARQPITLR
jgi:hypothetical protein